MIFVLEISAIFSSFIAHFWSKCAEIHQQFRYFRTSPDNFWLRLSNFGSNRGFGGFHFPPKTCRVPVDREIGKNA